MRKTFIVNNQREVQLYNCKKKMTKYDEKLRGCIQRLCIFRLEPFMASWDIKTTPAVEKLCADEVTL